MVKTGVIEDCKFTLCTLLSFIKCDCVCDCRSAFILEKHTHHRPLKMSSSDGADDDKDER